MGEVVGISQHLDALAAHVARLSNVGMEVDEQLQRRLRGVTYRILLDQDEEPQYEELCPEARAASNNLQANQAFLELCAAGKHEESTELRDLLDRFASCKQIHLHPTGDGIHPSAAAQLPARFHLPSIQLPLTEHAAVVSMLLALKDLNLQHERGLTTLLSIVASQNPAVPSGSKTTSPALVTHSNLPSHSTNIFKSNTESATTRRADVSDSKPWRDYVLSGGHIRAEGGEGEVPVPEVLHSRNLPGDSIRRWAAVAFPKSTSDGHETVPDILFSTNAHAEQARAAVTTRIQHRSNQHNHTNDADSKTVALEAAAASVRESLALTRTQDGQHGVVGVIRPKSGQDNGVGIIRPISGQDNGEAKDMGVAEDEISPASNLELSPVGTGTAQQTRRPLYDATNMFKKASSMQGGTFMRFTPDYDVPLNVANNIETSTEVPHTVHRPSSNHTQHTSHHTRHVSNHAQHNSNHSQHISNHSQHNSNHTGDIRRAPQYSSMQAASTSHGSISNGTSTSSKSVARDPNSTSGQPVADGSLGSWYPFPSVLNPSSSSHSDPTCWSEAVARLLAGSCYSTSTPGANLPSLAPQLQGVAGPPVEADKFETVSLERAGKPSASALATVLPVVFDPGFTTVFKFNDSSTTRAERGAKQTERKWQSDVRAKNLLVTMDEAVREQGAISAGTGSGSHEAGRLTGTEKLLGGQGDTSTSAGLPGSDDGVGVDPMTVERELCLMALHATQGIPSAVKAAVSDESARCGLHRWSSSSSILKRAADCGKMRIRLDAFVAYWAHAPHKNVAAEDIRQKDSGSFQDPILSAFVHALSSTLQGISIGLWDLYCMLDSAGKSENVRGGGSVTSSLNSARIDVQEVGGVMSTGEVVTDGGVTSNAVKRDGHQSLHEDTTLRTPGPRADGDTDEATNHKVEAAEKLPGSHRTLSCLLTGGLPTMLQFTLMSSTVLNQLKMLSLLCECQPSELPPVSLNEDLTSTSASHATPDRGHSKNRRHTQNSKRRSGDFGREEGWDGMEVDGEESGSGRPKGPYSEGYKRLRRSMAELRMEPSWWEARGEFKDGCELLGKLYDCVQRCDEATKPLLQHLFQVAFTPYVQHVWVWLYTPKPLHPSLTVLGSHSNPLLQWWPDDIVDPFPGTPCEGPDFMRSVHGMLVAAGQQLRFLSSLKHIAGDVSGSIWWLAQQEAAELTAIADAAHTPLSHTKITPTSSAPPAGSSSLSLLPLSGSLPASAASDQPLVPIIFERGALQQVCEVSGQAAKQRAAEVQRLLRRVREQRKEEEDAVRTEAMLRVQRQHAERELARQKKNEKVAQLRLRQSRMLKEQQRALDAAAAQRVREREERIAQEQEMLVSAVMREHTALAASLAAEVARNQALQPRLQAQGERYSWREKRLKLGAQRRALWMLIEAEEEKELREKLREHGGQLAGSQDMSTLELKFEHLKRLNIRNSGKVDMRGAVSSPGGADVDQGGVKNSLSMAGRGMNTMPDIPELDMQALENATSSSGLKAAGSLPASTGPTTGSASVDFVTEVTMTDVDEQKEPTPQKEPTSSEAHAPDAMDIDAMDVDEPAPSTEPTSVSLAQSPSQPASAQLPTLSAPPSFAQRKAISFPDSLPSRPMTQHAHHQNSDGVKYLFTSPHWAPTLPSQTPLVLDSDAVDGLPLTARSFGSSPSSTSRRSLSFKQVRRGSADMVMDTQKGRLRRGESVPAGFDATTMRAAGIKTGELSRTRGLWTMPADPLPAAGLSARRLQRSTSTPSSPAVGHPLSMWPGSPFSRQGLMAARQQQARGVRKQLSSSAVTPTKWGEHPWDLISTPAKNEQRMKMMQATPEKVVGDAGKLERAKVRRMWSQQDGKAGKRQGGSQSHADAEVSEVVDAYVLQPVTAQYQLLTHACWELMVKELKLLELCHAFKLFFFMDAGDFADSLASSLNSRLAGGNSLGPFTVQFLLEDAIASSAQASNEFAPCLTARFERGRRLYVESPQLMGADNNKLLDELEDGDAFCLQMQVKWPLSVVICSESMQLYSRIVSVLLRLRRVAKVLHQVWMALTKPSCHVSAAGNLVSLRSVVDPTAAASAAANMQKQRLMQARRWLSHALPLIASLQGAVQGSLVWGVESELLEQLSARPLSLMEMRQTHLRLVKQAASYCFLEAEEEDSPDSLPSVMSAVSAVWVMARQLSEAMSHDDRINPTSWVLEDSIWQGVKSSAERMMRYVKAVHRAVHQEAHRGGMAGNIAVLLDTEFYQRKSGRTGHAL